jgi:hypothetical protein
MRNRSSHSGRALHPMLWMLLAVSRKANASHLLNIMGRIRPVSRQNLSRLASSNGVNT